MRCVGVFCLLSPFFNNYTQFLICRHLQNNEELRLQTAGLSKHFPSLKSIRLHQEEQSTTTFNSTQKEQVFNITHFNLTTETKKVKIKCNFYQRPLSECSSLTMQECGQVLNIKEDISKMAPFAKTSCTYARCKTKEKVHAIKCLLYGISNTSESTIIGQNTGVKLSLWTFGLLAVTSNILVLITLLCNRETRRSALCVFVMNLLTANIFIGGYIVIITVLDTITYGNVDKYGDGDWQTIWCVPLFVIKHFGLTLMILSLVLLTVERALVLIFNSPTHVDICRALSYVIECWLFASIATVVMWSKLKDWGYMCSTFASSLPFTDISRGVKGTFTGICLVLVAFYIYIFIRMTLAEVSWRRTRKENTEHAIFSRETKTTTRLFLLVLTTFFSWAIPYVILLVLVPVSISVVTAMRTITIALAVNSCLHPFIFSYDNENLETLYSALACRRESTFSESPWNESPELRKKSTAIELEAGYIPRKSLESNSVVEVKSPLGGGTITRALPVTEMRAERSLSAETVKSACEIFRTDGAVVITPPKTANEEEIVVLMHSSPSSPTSTKEIKLPDETVSECGTISSDTNATWLTSDTPSIVPSTTKSSCRFNDGHSTGHSTISSVASTTPLFKPRRNSRRKLNRSTLRKSLSPKSDIDTDDESSCVEKSQPASTPNPHEYSADKESNERPLSPVEKLFKVLSPKVRRERPKTLPSHDFYKPVKGETRGKFIMERKEAEHRDCKSLQPVCARSKHRTNGRKRSGVLLFKAGEDGLEIQEYERTSIKSHSDKAVASGENNNQSDCKVSDIKNLPEGGLGRDWDSLATFLVIKPVAAKSKMKVNTKGRTNLNADFSKTTQSRNKLRIYENPTAEQNTVATPLDDQLKFVDVPLSPTSKKLAKLEGGDTLSALPVGIKQKYRNSTSSVTSSTCTRNSKSSLEWDPSCVDDGYDIDDELVPPLPHPVPPPMSLPILPPSPCPSTGSSAHTQVESDDQVDCVQVKLDPNNRYSLEWDPTGVQMRLSIITQASEADIELSEGNRDSYSVETSS